MRRAAFLAVLALAGCPKARRHAGPDAGPHGKPAPAAGESLAALRYLPASARTVVALNVRDLRASPFLGDARDFLRHDGLYRALADDCHIDALEKLDWAALTLAPLGDRKRPTLVLRGSLDEATLLACRPLRLAEREQLPGGHTIYSLPGEHDRAFTFVDANTIVSGDRAWLTALLGGAASAERGPVADRAGQMDTSKTAWVVVAEMPPGRKGGPPDRPVWMRAMIDLSAGLHAGAVLGFDSPVEANDVMQQLRRTVQYPGLTELGKGIKIEPVGERLYLTADFDPAQGRKAWLAFLSLAR